MRRSGALFAAAALLAGALAGCGETPRPYQTGDAIPPAAIEEAAEFEGISVALLEGAPEQVALPLAETVSQALQGMGTPASAGQRFRGRFTLAGRVADPGAPTAARPQPIADVVWRLIGPSGEAVTEFLQRINGPSGGWLSGDPAMLQRIAVDAAAPVSDAYRAALDAGIPNATASWAAVAMTSLSGLAGEQHAVMVRAMRHALSLRGVNAVNTAEAANYVLAGAFAIGPPRRGRRTVAVSWTVNDQNGRELGKVSQENFLPDPLSETLWRQISAAIAAGAGDGIVDLMRRTGARPGGPGAAIK